MFKKLIAIFAFAYIATMHVSAQNQNIYYSANMQLVSQTNAAYTLQLTPTTTSRFSGVLLDLMGTKRGEGEYLLIQKKYLEDGSFKYFHPNGKIESEGEFVKGIKVGSWKRYDATGKRKQDRYYPAEAADLIRDSMQVIKSDEEKTSTGE